MKEFVLEIPARFYSYCQPFRTNYVDRGGEGLAYRLSPEEEFEQRAAFGYCSGWGVVSLLSPYVLGWDFEYKAYQLELVDVDIQARTVTVRVKGS